VNQIVQMILIRMPQGWLSRLLFLLLAVFVLYLGFATGYSHSECRVTESAFVCASGTIIGFFAGLYLMALSIIMLPFAL
jgi:hypothetical protein